MERTKNYDVIEKLSIAFDNNDELHAVCIRIASEIESGRIKLFEIVEEMGVFLTNIDASIRENGVRSLSNLLSNISKNFLNEQELQLMTSFYCDRLNDHHSIISATISGIVAIVQMDNLPWDAPSKLIHTLLRNVRCQSELQETRKNIYLIFQTLLTSRLENLKSLGPDFVYGVISSMDGESDPRNLILLFNFLPHFMKEFNLYHFIEEMFEVIACYFPVDFNSYTKDERQITRDELANALELCLAAIPQFADYCLPLIIEKLATNLKTAKMDSLRLLVQSSTIFSVEGLKNYLDELWPLIRKEILPGSDQEIREQALTAVTAVTRALSGDEKVLLTFVDKIVADTRTSLCDVQLSLYWPAEKLMEAVGKASDKACRHILKIIVALCLAQYTTNISKTDRISLIETLNNFIAIYTEFCLRISDISELSWADLTTLYLNELSSIRNEDSLKAKIIDGLALQKASLTEFHRNSLYNEICDIIDCGNNITRQSCQSILITLAELYPNEILDIIDRELTLPDVETRILKNRIKALAPLARIPKLGSKVLPMLVELAISNMTEISLVSLNSIKMLLSLSNYEYNIHYFLFNNCNIMDKIFRQNLQNGHVTSHSSELCHLESNICLLIMRKLSADHQRNVVEEYFSLLKVDIANNISLWEGILTPLMSCNVTHQIIQLFVPLLEISLYNSSGDTRLSCCRLAATIVNKMNDNDNLEECLNLAHGELMRILNDDLVNRGNKQAAVMICTWITKALITRGHLRSREYFDYQLNLLQNELIGEFAGGIFHVFVDKHENTLVEENFCNIKIFYKQRVFQNIIEQNDKFMGTARQNYLIALIHVVEEIPMEILFMHLVKLVPLLIESLSLDNGQLISSTLRTLRLLLDTKNDIFIEQIQSFVSRCLKLSTHSKMHVRIAALNCLKSYCHYPTASIKPYKDDVLEKLSDVIDDKKRLVRQIAVTARIRWYLVGAPGGPE